MRGFGSGRLVRAPQGDGGTPSVRPLTLPHTAHNLDSNISTHRTPGVDRTTTEEALVGVRGSRVCGPLVSCGRYGNLYDVDGFGGTRRPSGTGGSVTLQIEKWAPTLDGR